MDIYMKIKLTIGLLYFLQTLTYIQGEYIYTYVGCFKDRESPRALSAVRYIKNKGNTIKKCANFCWTKGYRYAGLQYGEECWCGNSGFDRYGQGDGCVARCTGNSNQVCGGDWRNSVYSIITKTTTFSTTPTTATTTITTAKTTPSFTTTNSIDTRTTTSNTPATTESRTSARNTGVYIGIGVGVFFVCATIVLVVVLVIRRRSKDDCMHRRNVNDRNVSTMSAGKDKHLNTKAVTHSTVADNSCEYEEVDLSAVQMSNVYESMCESTSHVYGKLNQTEDTEVEL